MLKPSLQLKLGQTLTMTPQLQQAIRLLQLPVLDLSAQIQDALEENIMLEMEDLPDVPQTSGETTAEIETIRAEDSWQSRSDQQIQDGGWNGEGRPITEFADESGQTLREHLLWQLEMEDFSARQTLIGEAIIDSINDDGYLTIELDEVPGYLDENMNVSSEEIEATLVKVQRMDPIGVAARSIPECLVLQLRQLDAATPGLALAIELAENNLNLVANREYGELRRSLRASEEDLHDALALVKSCNPKPGLAVSSAAAASRGKSRYTNTVCKKKQITRTRKIVGRDRPIVLSLMSGCPVCSYVPTPPVGPLADARRPHAGFDY